MWGMQEEKLFTSRRPPSRGGAAYLIILELPFGKQELPMGKLIRDAGTRQAALGITP